MRSNFLFMISLTLLILIFPKGSFAQSSELIMFDSRLCEWCEVWDKEIGIVYSKTPEGKRAPLKRINIHAKRPLYLKKIKPVIFTPTFVLINNGSEVGRIVGYPGEDFFWGLLENLLKKVPEQKRLKRKKLKINDLGKIL